jgi:cytochrome b subunit of formate dehydrogenase
MIQIKMVTTSDLLVWNLVMFIAVCLIVSIVFVLLIREKSLYFDKNDISRIIVIKDKKEKDKNEIYSVMDHYA